jgi:hypothetical protein
VRNQPEFRRCIAEKAVVRFKHRVRELTRRHRGIALERMTREWASYLRGWAGYFGFSQWHELQSLRLDSAPPALRRLGPVEDAWQAIS